MLEPALCSIGVVPKPIHLLFFLQNIYYGTLYAYTPEVLPSAHRGTGNGISIGFNRIMGIMSAVIA